ncbi:hypothetical protein ACOME3_007365 [Neoechinorhynchus agilis]
MAIKQSMNYRKAFDITGDHCASVDSTSFGRGRKYHRPKPRRASLSCCKSSNVQTRIGYKDADPCNYYSASGFASLSVCCLMGQRFVDADILAEKICKITKGQVFVSYNADNDYPLDPLIHSQLRMSVVEYIKDVIHKDQ